MKKARVLLEEILEVARTLFEESLIEEPEIEILANGETHMFTPELIMEAENDFHTNFYSEDSELYNLYSFLTYWELENIEEIHFEVQESSTVRNEEINAEVAAVFNRGVGYDATTYLKL